MHHGGLLVECAWVSARSRCLKLTRHQVCATRAAFKMGDMAWTFPDMGQHASWCYISGQIDFVVVSWLDSSCRHPNMDWFGQFFLLRESSNLWSMVEHHNISKISVLRRDVSTSGMHFISPLWLYVSPSKHSCLLLYVVTEWFWLHVFYKSNYLKTSFHCSSHSNLERMSNKKDLEKLGIWNLKPFVIYILDTP